MIDRQYIDRLPSKRLFLMLVSWDYRLRAWLEMAHENYVAGRDGYSTHDDGQVAEYAAGVLGERLDEARRGTGRRA